MQTVPRVLQHMVNAPTVKVLKVGFKGFAHLLGCGAFLTWRKRVILMNIRFFKGLQLAARMRQAGGGQSPRPDRGSNQIHGLLAARQPLVKQITIQRAKNQALGATRRARYDANVFGTQTLGM